MNSIHVLLCTSDTTLLCLACATMILNCCCSQPPGFPAQCVRCVKN